MVQSNHKERRILKTIAFVPLKLNNERLPGKNTKSLSDGTPLSPFIVNFANLITFTQRIERDIMTLKTRLKRQARRTICVLYSVESHEMEINTFIEKHSQIFIKNNTTYI